jgi:predicted TIM-barrel fold metal-dependent hydrolase
MITTSRKEKGNSPVATSEPDAATSSDRALIISTDGHAKAEMKDYRPYLPSRLHEEFDVFCSSSKDHWMGTADSSFLAKRCDLDVAEKWQQEVVDAKRLEGLSDPDARIAELDRNGFAAEVLFPESGLPFELGGQVAQALLMRPRTREQIVEGNKAHNRWLADFCTVAPERFAAMAVVSLDDVDDAIKEIRWAKETGLKGILLPHFDEMEPIYHPRFEPIWNTVVELEMGVNAHSGMSSISSRLIPNPSVLEPPEFAFPMMSQIAMFNTRQLLHHLIWGGVLERHPKMKVVFTEAASGWVIGDLISMDYSYEGSYLRRDIHEMVRHKPSDYFRRQCSLGSSLFSEAEVEARHLIGLDQMALGFDYPHQEGAWASGPGPVGYMKATLGVAGVPKSEAEKILGGNAAAVWDFDLSFLGELASGIGPTYAEILTPPASDEYPRGDVHKPLGGPAVA